MKLKWPAFGSIGGRAGSASSGAAVPSLVPLTPAYDSAQHGGYVEGLTQALEDDSIRNIALTGRYGAGKSSVLTEFSAMHGDRVLMLTLSTLGLDDKGESGTNQIEKELVKQLLHSRPPRDLPQSRYRRIESLSVPRAVISSAVQLAVVGGLLRFLNLFPEVALWSSSRAWPVRVAALAAFAALAIAALTWIRLAVHNRVVASVSAAGASIALSEKQASYFDQYLDEIVYYFESTPVDVVVFEDLDRFNDPRIFEALRELNSLLNAAGVVKGKTVRFVYALKDSIFELLGKDTKEMNGDAAEAESVRANRTKFFDLVIPVVPFITHRSSRDLLTRLLKEEALLPVSPELIDLTARHITDMRLLKNIRNEYAVFATRLITAKHGVENLRPDSVFALMVYKNIHLADFEQIQVGRSDLDSLYRASRELVDESIARRWSRLGQIDDGEALADLLEQKSTDFAARLRWYVESIGRILYPNYGLTRYAIGGVTYDAAAVTGEFWHALLQTGSGIRAVLSARHQSPVTMDLAFEQVEELFRQDLRREDWDTREKGDIEAERDRLNAEVDLLRRPEFATLARHPEFTVSQDGGEVSFDELLGEILRSEIARDLVREGFIDQNFALYVAQYYGDRLSLPALNFIVQHVQTGTPDTNYPFPRADDIASVLRETRADFLDQDTAYNIAILDYLLAEDESGAGMVLGRIARLDGPAEHAFLGSYLARGSQACRAVSLLVEVWPSMFRRLIETFSLDRKRRLALVSAALEHSAHSTKYELDEPVAAWLRNNYEQLDCLTQSIDETLAANAVRTLRRAHVVIVDLAILDPAVLEVVIQQGEYPVTAANLRTALGDPDTLSLDAIRMISDDVYQRCCLDPHGYLHSMDEDDTTTAAVLDPTTFEEVVTDLSDWEPDLAAEAFRRAAHGCEVADLANVPTTMWPALARARRFPVTLDNVVRYADEVGGIDDDLAAVLVDAGRIEVSGRQPGGEDAAELQLAERILNSATTIPAPQDRVALVSSLKLTTWITPSAITPEEGHLLGQLIEHRVCEDSIELFRRFHAAEWPTLSYAIQRSTNVTGFITPEILDEEMVALALADSAIDGKLKTTIVRRLPEFVPSDHRDALQAAAHFAAASATPVEPDQLERIARVTGDGPSVVELVSQLGDAITPVRSLAVLVAARGPYADLATSGAEVTLPNIGGHLAIANRLKQAGCLAKVSVKRTKRELTVTVA
ncbi:hypothetical protein ACIBL3_37840 [Kribbella sp. NPDC050124]|uniref:YobI family P-loop NTPase n=1 Tax=Kribbella sp. NPDC050124 TaxID=3364114 RepID=UPI0037BD2DC9